MSKETNTAEAQVAVYQTNKDMMTSVFIVSVLLNLVVFITWLLVETSHYNLLLVANR